MRTYNKIKSVILIVSMFILTSCSSWLDLEPENDLIKDEYWKTKADVEAVLVGAYSSMSSLVNTCFMWGELRGDMLAITLKTPTDYQRIMTNTISDNSSVVKWSGFYKTINYTNFVIKQAASVRELDPSYSQAELDAHLAEAYFIRSLCYFYLVRSFGEVPFVTEPSESDKQNYDLPKSKEIDILNQIISDLDLYKDKAKDEFSRLEYTKGRATSAALYSLLADVYLWRASVKIGASESATADLEACVQACETIREMNYSLVPSDQWYTLFYPGNSSESIFEVQFDRNLGQTNSFLNTFSSEVNFNIAAISSIESLYESNVGDVRAAGSSFFSTSSGYCEIWKYLGTGRTTTGTDNRRPKDLNDNNFIVYRLADIYLMEAEARVLLSNTDNVATTLLSDIKSRASVTPGEWTTSLSEILAERSRELAYEGKRWYDLLRFAKRSQQGRDMILELLLASVSAADRPFFEHKFKDFNCYYFPIHKDELKENPNLVQNPFYVN